MMKLSTMWHVDATVDAEGRSPVAEAVLAPWEHDPGSARFVRSSANFVYRFECEGKRRFLRFAERSERRRDAIEAEVELLTWLTQAGINVAAPLPSKQGNLVETTVSDHGIFHAVVFAGLDGASLDVEELTEAQFRTWGAALSELHAVLKHYRGASASARSTWKDHLAFARRVIPADQPAIRHELDQIAWSLRRLPVDRDAYGLIHFDFELDNLVWQDGTIGILDFDECAHYWRVADIAFALRDLFRDGINLNDPSFRAFVDGYAAQSPLDDHLLAQVPLFLRLANLLVSAKIARGLDLQVTNDHPAWLVELDCGLRNRMERYAASLEKHD